MATSSLHDEYGDKINCAADWLIDRMEDWALGKLPSYQRLCRAIADNAKSIRNLNRPGQNTNGSTDVGILTLMDRIGGLLHDDYFVTVTGDFRTTQARYRVNVIRGAAFARQQQREHGQPEQQARRVA